VLEAIRQTLRQQAYTVPAGMALRYVFHGVSSAEPLVLRYKYASSLTSKDPVACVIVAGAVERPDRYQKPELSAPNGLHSVTIPAAMIAADGTLAVEIANVHPVPVAMIFAPADGVQLLVPTGGFAMNLVRCLLVKLLELAFLGALAVTIGCCFSFPVAAVTAAYAVMLMNIGNYLQTLMAEKFIFGSAATPNAGPNIFDLAIHYLYVALYWLTKPFQTVSPLEPLAAGELVSWGWVGSALLWQVLVAGGVVAAVGTWALNRRELGLPE
jgi:hypothetical protein